MAMRSAIARISPISRSAALEASSLRISRCFSDGKGKVLSEEERAAENVYIQKMERERAEKLKLKTEKEKAQLEKEKGEKYYWDASPLTSPIGGTTRYELGKASLKSDQPKKG